MKARKSNIVWTAIKRSTAIIKLSNTLQRGWPRRVSWWANEWGRKEGDTVWIYSLSFNGRRDHHGRMEQVLLSDKKQFLCRHKNLLSIEHDHLFIIAVLDQLVIKSATFSSASSTRVLPFRFSSCNGIRGESFTIAKNSPSHKWSNRSRLTGYPPKLPGPLQVGVVPSVRWTPACLNHRARYKARQSQCHGFLSSFMEINLVPSKQPLGRNLSLLESRRLKRDMEGMLIRNMIMLIDSQLL